MMTEQQIQTKIIKKLEKDGWYVVKIIKCNKNGFPDIIALREGEVKFYEVKRPKFGITTALQNYVLSILTKMGFYAKVTTSEQDL
jgi:Holliday junction resolvase